MLCSDGSQKHKGTSDKQKKKPPCTACTAVLNNKAGSSGKSHSMTSADVNTIQHPSFLRTNSAA